jgi:ribose-phosphate diphosphokinase
MKDIVVFSLTSNKELVKEICEFLKITEGEINIEHFADGEVLVVPKESVRGKKVFIIQSTCNPVNDRLMELLVCVDAVKRASAKEIAVIVPYYGYARQDRKAAARQPITAKLVADLLMTAGINRIITVDLHAQQIQGFFDIATDDLTFIPLIGSYFEDKFNINDEIVVVSPDHGGTVRARSLAEILHAPIAIIDKRRPRPNVVEVNNVIGDVKDKICIVVDDICDTGGSLVAGVNLLKEYGAKEIYTCVTHGVFSKDVLDKIDKSPIKEMIISNTIPLSKETLDKYKKIKVLSIGEMLASIISNIAKDKSVSKIFDMYKIKRGRK